MNYLKKVLKLPSKPGSVNHVLVLHDSWCDLLNHKGPCNCNPDVEPLKEEKEAN